MPRIAVIPLLALAAAACGGGGSPAGPSAPPPATTQPTAPTPSPTPAPTPTPAPAATVLRMASIGGANGHSAAGTARIVREGSQHRIDFSSDFRIDSSNNDIYLARGTSLDMSRDLFVAPLAQRTGAQSYALPDAGPQYSYVIIWCRPFRIPIGIGELR